MSRVRVRFGGWRHEEADDEAAGLRVWAGRGAVRLFEADVFGATSALVVERCDPGTTLGQAMPEPEQNELVGLLRRLWRCLAGERAVDDHVVLGCYTVRRPGTARRPGVGAARRGRGPAAA